MPQEIDRELVKCEGALYAMQENYPRIARDAANKRVVYDVAWSEAVDEIAHRQLEEGCKAPTGQMIDAMATKMVSAQLEDARKAEAELDIAKRHLSSLESILSSVQSRVKLVLIEKGLDNYRT